jgi:hypothetical protein
MVGLPVSIWASDGHMDRRPMYLLDEGWIWEYNYKCVL